MYLNERTKFEITFAPGQTSNNKPELAALWSILRLALDKQLKKLQLSGDSNMTIDWANGGIQIYAPRLQHLLKSIREKVATFETISFNHIYRELNIEADKL